MTSLKLLDTLNSTLELCDFSVLGTMNHLVDLTSGDETFFRSRELITEREHVTSCALHLGQLRRVLTVQVALGLHTDQQTLLGGLYSIRECIG